MKQQGHSPYRQIIDATTAAIHGLCGSDINILWDDGSTDVDLQVHPLKIWNGLGSLEFSVRHVDLEEKGHAYAGFLALVAAKVKSKLML